MYRGCSATSSSSGTRVGDRSLQDADRLRRAADASARREAKPRHPSARSVLSAGVADLMTGYRRSSSIWWSPPTSITTISPGSSWPTTTFKPFKIGKVWMAWTEDRRQDRERLSQQEEEGSRGARGADPKIRSLARGATRCRRSTICCSSTAASRAFRGQCDGRREAGRPAAKLAGNASCEAVLEWLQAQGGRLATYPFLKPGEVLRWGVDDAFRAYVLGPPREDDKLRKLNPSKGSRARSVSRARRGRGDRCTGSPRSTAIAAQSYARHRTSPSRGRTGIRYSAKGARRRQGRESWIKLKDPIVEALRTAESRLACYRR